MTIKLVMDRTPATKTQDFNTSVASMSEAFTEMGLHEGTPSLDLDSDTITIGLQITPSPAANQSILDTIQTHGFSLSGENITVGQDAKGNQTTSVPVQFSPVSKMA